MRRMPTLAMLAFASCVAAALAQQSPAPDRPAEGPLRANPGTTAPGVHPPSPMDGSRFAPGPPPPMPGTQETPPGGQVKTEEKIGTPGVTAGTPSSPGWTPTAPAIRLTPAKTPAAGSRTPRKGTPGAAGTTPRMTPRPSTAVTPVPTPQ